MTKKQISSRNRLVGGGLIAVASLLLCGSTPATVLKVVTPAPKVNAKETQFALATVQDVNKDQRSEMVRLAAKYPQLFIQACATPMAVKPLHR